MLYIVLVPQHLTTLTSIPNCDKEVMLSAKVEPGLDRAGLAPLFHISLLDTRPNCCLRILRRDSASRRLVRHHWGDRGSVRRSPEGLCLRPLPPQHLCHRLLQRSVPFQRHPLVQMRPLSSILRDRALSSGMKVACPVRDAFKATPSLILLRSLCRRNGVAPVSP